MSNQAEKNSWEKSAEITAVMNLKSIQDKGDLNSRDGMDHIMALADIKKAAGGSVPITDKTSLKILFEWGLVDQSGTIHDLTKRTVNERVAGEHPFYKVN